MEVCINDFEIEFDDSDYESARILNAFYQLAVLSRNEYIKSYEKCGSINKVIKESVKDLKSIYKEVTDLVVSELNKNKVWGITSEVFTSKCLERCSAFSDEIEKVYGSYMELTNQKRAYEAQMQARKNSRGRVVGGGFGLSGAIKGMLIAGTINAVIGTVNSAFDLLDSSSVNSSFDKALKELYRSSSIKNALANAVYNDIKSMMDIYYEFLWSKYPDIEMHYDFDSIEEAKNIEKNIKNHVIPEEDIPEALVDMLIAFPAYEDAYYAIYKLCGTSNGDLIRLSEFFDINLDLRSIEENDNLLLNYFGECLEDIERELRYNQYYQKLKHNVNEPVEDLIFKCIELSKERGLDRTYISSIFEFKDHNNNQHLNTARSSFARFSDYETPLLYFDTTVFKSGKAGVLLTDKCIYSSKGNKVFSIADINKIEEYGDLKIDGISIPEAYNKRDQAEMLEFIVKVLKFKNGGAISAIQLQNSSVNTSVELACESVESMRNIENAEKEDDTQSILSEIEHKFLSQLCRDSSYGDYLFTVSNLNNDGKNRMKKALSIYAKEANSESILIFYDNTMMRSGKEGFLITNKCIYYKNKFGEGRVELHDVDQLQYKMMSLLPNLVVNEKIIMPCKFLDHDNVKAFGAIFLDMKEFIQKHLG